VPAVGSTGGPAEYVEDGISGLVLPPREPESWAEAISDLLDDPARLASMGVSAREVAGRFSDEAYADGCMAAYAAALDGAHA
jgi:D-inositol-3-phosphate glycosyltransferase